MNEDLEVLNGGIASVVGIEVGDVRLSAYLPDHLDAVRVRRALLEGADRLARAAIYSDGINATDDVSLESPEQLKEAPKAVSEGGLEFDGPEINWVHTVNSGTHRIRSRRQRVRFGFHGSGPDHSRRSSSIRESPRDRPSRTASWRIYRDSEGPRGARR